MDLTGINQQAGNQQAGKQRCSPMSLYSRDERGAGIQDRGPSCGGEDRGRREPPSDLVWGFNMPHVIGSVCSFPCGQCGTLERPGALYGPTGEDIPQTAIKIVAPATIEDWRR